MYEPMAVNFDSALRMGFSLLYIIYWREERWEERRSPMTDRRSFTSGENLKRKEKNGRG